MTLVKSLLIEFSKTGGWVGEFLAIILAYLKYFLIDYYTLSNYG